jgi:pyruvate dehydrogenase E1 component alpha subunit
VDEVKKVKENKDCLMLFTKRVTEQGLLTQAQLDAIDKEVAAEIEASVVHAKSSAKPTQVDLMTDVYVSYP